MQLKIINKDKTGKGKHALLSYRGIILNALIDINISHHFGLSFGKDDWNGMD
jgi:hypothetical protein